MKNIKITVMVTAIDANPETAYHIRTVEWLSNDKLKAYQKVTKG